VKIKKQAYYNVIFQHHIDSEDKIAQTVQGLYLFKLRNLLDMSGYQMKSCELVE
jgi:hypothetical protein